MPVPARRVFERLGAVEALVGRLARATRPHSGRLKREHFKMDSLCVNVRIQIALLREALAAVLAHTGPIRQDIRALIMGAPPRGVGGRGWAHLSCRCFDSMCRLTRCFLDVYPQAFIDPSRIFTAQVHSKSWNVEPSAMEHRAYFTHSVFIGSSSRLGPRGANAGAATAMPGMDEFD